jgi:hypothetical protein
MARVFERPRYINQARNKLIHLGIASDSYGTVEAVCKTLNVHRNVVTAVSADFTSYAELAMGGRDVDDLLPNTATQLEQYLLDAEIGRLSREGRMTQPEVAHRIISDYLSTVTHFNPSEVYTDEQALFYLIGYAMDEELTFLESADSQKARHVARDLISLQLVGQKVAAGRWINASSSSRFLRGLHPAASKYDAWLRGAENLQYRAHPMWVKYSRLWAMDLPRLKPHVRKMVDEAGSRLPHERHCFDALDGCVNADTKACYNYSGVIVIFLEDKQLILDNSLCDYFRVVMTSLRNAYISFSDYRLTGDAKPCDMLPPFVRAVQWIRRAILDVTNARFVARHMHLAYTRWQNIVGESSSRIDCGALERDKSLKDDLCAIYPGNTEWYDLVLSFDLPERLRAEIFKLYHLLPPPDIDPLLLHREISAKTNTTNPYDTAKISAFIKFCAAYDLCRFMVKNRRVPKTQSEDGEPWRDSPWAKSCLAGKMRMPPRDKWGSVRIRGEFPYDFKGDFHALSAKDSTRVVADINKYMDRADSRSLGQFDSNELLSALFNGSRLSNGELMSEWRDRVMSGGLRPDDCVIAAEAGKAENTKPGKKVRETLSACDTVREFLTEIDHSLRPLAAQTPGVSIRVDYVRHKRKFQTMANALSRYSNKTALGTSTDITGWSPNMPRHMFHAWQDYAIATTECPNPSAVRSLWDRLTLFVDRRGVKESTSCPEGNIQGWPATSDTTMHAHILIYWAWELREKKILSKDEAALTLCLIDDAATVVILEGSEVEAKAKADRARELLKTMYAELGFVMDDVKSFFSAVKFVYLNELYLDGAQVAHATKTMMRIDRDHSRRFASLPEQVSSTMGVAASAANQGADPFMAYWLAAWSSLRLAYSVHSSFAEMDHYAQALVCLTPAGMNGLGMRPMCALFATGAMDTLSWFLEICDGVNDMGLDTLIDAIISQEPSIATAMSAFKSPFAYTVTPHVSVTAMVRRAFREAAKAHNLAEPFKSLEQLEEDPEYVSSITAVLESGEHEAALLEEVSSCMPESFVDEILARVDKTELIAALLGSVRIGSLRRHVSEADRVNLSHLCERIMLHQGTSNTAALHSAGSFAYAQSLRSRHLGEFAILNHTYPCPFSLWAFQGNVDLTSEQASRLTTASFELGRCMTTIGSNGRNLYDSRLERIGFKGYRSVGTTVSNETRISLYNPVKKKIGQGLAALRWARDSGAHHNSLARLFLYAWSGQYDERLITLPGRQFEGSAKRLSLRHSKVNHLVMMWPNTQACCRVDARAISRALGARHHMHDVMAAITALRASALLEAALYLSTGEGSFSYGFAYKADASAWMAAPSARERIVSRAVLERIRSFTSIDSEMAASAKATCTLGVMQKCLQEHLVAGSNAASKLFQLYVDEGMAELAEEHVMDTELIRPTIGATATSRREAPRMLILSEVVRPVLREGFIADNAPRPARAAPVMASMGALSDQEALRALGQSTLDTRALALASHNSTLAAALWNAHVKHDIQGWVESAEKDIYNVILTDDALNRLVSSVEELRGSTSFARALTEALYSAGMPGFRYAGEAADVGHSLRSFVHESRAIFGYTRAICTSLAKLKGRTSEEYARSEVAGVKVAAAAVSEVVKAKWRFAAARRELQARDAVSDGNGWDKMSERIFEAAFLRDAAATLKATGKITKREMYAKMVDTVVENVARRIRSEADRNTYMEEIAMSGLDDSDNLVGVDEAIEAVLAVVEVGKRFVTELTATPLIAALRSVCEWVDADVSATHTIRPLRAAHLAVTPVPSRQLTASATPAQKTEMEEAASRLITVRGGLVDAGDESTDLAEVPPEVVYGWFTDDAERFARWGREDGDMFAGWAEVSASKESWLAFLPVAQAAAGADEHGFLWPEMSIFDPPEWAGDGEDGEWVG